MAEQLPLDLGRRPALGREAFLVSAANATALAALDAPSWPGQRMALVGPEGAGKTHLACVWAGEAGAVITDAAAADMPLEAPALVIEDVDRIAGDRAAEERVFHLHNAVLSGGGRLLVTGRSAPADWPLVLPDLTSRLRAAAVARLDAPDEALLAGLLVKLLADRHIRASAPLITYLTRRIERSFAAAEAAVARLDAEAMARGRSVNRALAVELFGADS